MSRIFDATTYTLGATRSKVLDYTQTNKPVNLAFYHYIEDATAGAYLSFRVLEMPINTAKSRKTAVNITSCQRVAATGLVTVTFGAAHGYEVGDIIIIENSPYADFNGAWKVNTLPLVTTLTFFQVGANEGPTAGGTAKRVRTLAYTGPGSNFKTANTATSYKTFINNFLGTLEVTLNIDIATGGINTVWLEECWDGTGPGDVNVTGVGGNVAVTVASGSDVTLGATGDAAVMTNTTGTISGKLRGVIALMLGVLNGAGTRLLVTADAITGTVTCVDPVFGTIACGELAGSVNNTTPTQMPTQACRLVKFRAASDNAGSVYIGGSSVTVKNGTTDTTTGLQLLASQETGWIPVSNLNVLWRVSDAATDDLTYIAMVS